MQQFNDVSAGNIGLNTHDDIPIISGTFNSIPLYIILFNTIRRSLSISRRMEAHGPHQYLATSPGGGWVYATSWGVPSRLWSWEVMKGVGVAQGGVGLEERGSVPITAVSSYITVTNTHIYSMGGPTGEIHKAPNSTSSTGFGEKIQEMVYVPEGELEGWDKTNKALRYGTHAIEFGLDGRAYVPDLGLNCIHVHQLLPSGNLEYVTKVISPRDGDGPRHVVVSNDGKRVYAVTEHTQFLDVYDVTDEGLTWVHSASVIPEGDNPHDYRGDTLRLSKSTSHIFVTTRGKDSSVRGYLVAFALDSNGYLAFPSAAPTASYQTPTSGGKANAIEVTATNGRGKEGELDWLVLTDGEEGFVMVLGWDGERFEEVDRVQFEDGDVASHAIWLDQ